MTDPVDVFVAGENGCHTYRIPSLVITGSGSILAFCEARMKSADDYGDIDLVTRHSQDGGKTWSDVTVIHREDGDVTFGNPCPIYDPETGTIHLLCTRNNRRLFCTRSEDDGKTWAPLVDHTAIFTGMNYALERLATGPVHGIRMTSGRLIAPLWVSEKDEHSQPDVTRKCTYQSGVLYSDDGGVTWQRSGLVPPEIALLNECTVIERTDGSLLLNIRAFGAGCRAVSVSTDSGLTWSKPILEEALPCPTCQASMIGFGEGRVLFSNPNHSSDRGYDAGLRSDLTLRLSLDEGKTWPGSAIVQAGPAGYSDLAVTAQGTILCLYETGKTDFREKIAIREIDAGELS